jgi:hypothetical protein
MEKRLMRDGLKGRGSYVAKRRIPARMAKGVNRTDLWKLYWQLNSAKAQVYLRRLEHSISKNEKAMHRRLLDAWKD